MATRRRPKSTIAAFASCSRSKIVLCLLLLAFLRSSLREPDLTHNVVTNINSESSQDDSPSLSAMVKKQAQQDKDEGSMMECLKNTLRDELPLKWNKQKRQEAFAHHWDARNRELWGPAVEYRFKPMDALDEQRTNCSVWEVGAHERASDSRELMKMYGECRYHAFEPIPKFASVLKRNWNGESRMTIHSYGIGKSDTTFSVSDAVLKGQATFITNDGNDNNTTGGGANVAEIKSFDRVLGQIGSIPTLLHMNCEGCEWEFLVDAKEHGFLDAVPVIQVGWHNYGEVGLGARVWQLCELRQMLSETHTMTNGLAFGWDRWERRKQQ